MSLYQEYHYCINKKDAFLSFVLSFLIIITVLLLNKITIPYFYIPFTTVKILLALALFCLFMCLKPYEKIVLTEQSITFVKHPLMNQKNHITLYTNQKFRTKGNSPSAYFANIYQSTKIHFV